jgi:uncharacterized protein
MRADADAKRAAQMVAADLGDPAAAVISTPVAGPMPPPRVPQAIEIAPVSPSIAAAEAAVAEAMRVTGTESPATAGADFARPSAARPAPATRPATDIAAVSAHPPRAVTAVTASPISNGPWKVQLGAFSVPGNADRAWAQVAGNPALSGKSRQTLPAGRLTRLLAAGWASQAAAQSACNALKAAGHSCLTTR